MKKIITKKYNIDRAYLGLVNVPPGKYPTIKEIELASKILDILEEKASDHFSLLKEGDKLNEKYQGVTDKDSDWKNYMDEVNSLNVRIKSKESIDREKTVEIEMEDQEFNQFFQFFEKWGKEWFMKIKEFLEFRKDMNEANSRPKRK